MAIIFPGQENKQLTCSEFDNNYRELLKRGNHTDTQLAATISDLKATVQAYDFIVALEQCCIDLTNRLNQLEEDLFGGAGKLAQLIADLQAELDNLLNNLDTFLANSALIQALQACCTDLTNRIIAIETAIPIIQDDITNLTALVNTKAPIDSPTFTGSVLIPTPDPGDNINTAVNIEYISNAINSIPQQSVPLGVPIGAIMSFGGSTAPTTWLICNGAEISRAAPYDLLFSILGTTFGAGDGSTTFNLPDLRTRVPVGVGTGFSLGATGGAQNHTLTTAQMPSHTHADTPHNHGITDPGHRHPIDKGQNYGPGGPGEGRPGGQFSNQLCGTVRTGITINDRGINIQATGGSQPHNNMQPYIVLNYIVKATF